MNDYTPIPIEVTNQYGRTERYRSKFLTCKACDIVMRTLQEFLRRPQGIVYKGRYRGWQFRVVE